MECSATVTVLSYVINHNNGEQTCILSKISEKLSEVSAKVTESEFTSIHDAADLIKRSFIKSDYVFLLAETTNSSIINEINLIISKIFNENVSKTELLLNSEPINVLQHMKIFTSNLDNNCGIVLYIQGLFLIFFNNLEPLLCNYVVPYLKRRLLKNQIKKNIFTSSNNLDNNISFCNNKNVNVEVTQGVSSSKITISSLKLTELLVTERLLRDILGEKILKIEEELDLEKFVYNYEFSYVKESIEVIENCFKTFGPENVLIAFNGGKDCMVLLHMTLAVLKKNFKIQTPTPLCLYVQYSDPFEELEIFVDQCTQLYNLNLVKFQCNVKEALDTILKNHPNLKACLMGTRRNDPFASNLKICQMTDPDWPQLLRVSPLLDWHYGYIWDYLLDLQVPYCTLYDQGYTSIGGRLNTKPNPFLLYENFQNHSKKYLPAYKLLDSSKERNGRIFS